MNEYQGNTQGNDNELNYYDIYTRDMLREARKTFSRYSLAILSCLTISYAVSFLVQIVMALTLDEVDFSIITGNVYFTWLLGVGPMYLLGIPTLFLIVRPMKRKQREKKGLSVKDFLLYFAIAFGFMIFGNIIGTTVNGAISAILGRTVTNATSELIDNSPLWLLIIVVVVIGPILEELVFRKLMIDRLSRYGDGLAIIVSSVAFGLFHGNFYQFFYATLLGALFGYMYTKTGNAVYNTVMHMLINLFGAIVSLFMMDFITQIEEMALALVEGMTINIAKFFQLSLAVSSYAIVEYALAIGGIIILFNLVKNKMIKVDPICEYTIPKEKRLQTVLLNPGTISLLILSVAIFAMGILVV